MTGLDFNGHDTEQSWLLALQASTGPASHRLTWHRTDTAQSQPLSAVPHCVQRNTEGHSAIQQHSAPSRTAGTEQHSGTERHRGTTAQSEILRSMLTTGRRLFGCCCLRCK
jgi:hypothetical protein